MAKLSALEVVDKMLEDFSGPGGGAVPPAGSPEDPWRQAGLKKMNFKAKDFLGHNPGKKLPIKHAMPAKHAARFNWKPTEQK